MPKRLCVLLAACAVLEFGGCVTQSLIRKPPAGNASNPSKVTNPVLVQLDWSHINNAVGSPTAAIDGNDITPNLTFSGQTASGTFMLSGGSHELGASISINSSLYPRHTEILDFIVVSPAFDLALNPPTISIPPGGMGSSTVTLQPQNGFNGTAQLTVSNPPASLSATVTPPGNATQWQIAVSALPTAPSQQSNLTVTGAGPCTPNCTGTLTVTKTLAVIVPPPKVNSATPSVQQVGGTVTISGANFSPGCANNVVTIAGMNVTPTACTATSLTFSVPSQAPLGGTSISVTTSMTKSNSINFTVARQPGNFVEITSDIVGQTSSGRTCSTGAVRLDVCPPNCAGHPVGAYVATYTRIANNTPIGQPIEFRKDNLRVAGLGGAGFSLCTLGIVLDGDASGYIPQLMAFKFLDLQSGSAFQANPYGFNYVTPAGNASYNPRIFRSPDGTVILVVTPANIGPPQLTAGFIDKVSGRVISQVGITQVTGTISASITSANQISFSFGGTTFPLINIP
jgi:hypothetical protein